MTTPAKLVSELKKIFSAPMINPNINILPYSSQNDKVPSDHLKIWR